MTSIKDLEKFRDYYAKAGNGLLAGIYQAQINKKLDESKEYKIKQLQGNEV